MFVLRERLDPLRDQLVRVNQNIDQSLYQSKGEESHILVSPPAVLPVMIWPQLLWETNPKGEGDDDAFLETDTAKNTM